MTVTRPRAARLGLIALLGATVVVGGNVVAQPARAEAPAKWAPLLMARPSELRIAPGVAVGSPEDRAELDAIVAKQAQPLLPKDRIEYWTAGPSPVRWNEILLAAVRKAKTNPVRVSRSLALLNAAMYDAIIAACDAKVANRRQPPAQRDSRIKALAPFDDLSSHASVDAAIAAAAVAVLRTIYPDRTKDFEAQGADLLRSRLVAGTHTASD
ncbi:MAG: hypothetical protein M3Q66_04855, partial [Chloroflexota bacterium]|nr:hypothetical protein [Chloroflexota bacterium]